VITKMFSKMIKDRVFFYSLTDSLKTIRLDHKDLNPIKELIPKEFEERIVEE
jgi:hypothetical protein